MTTKLFAAFLLTLIGLVGAPAAHAQDRETFTFDPPERTPNPPESPLENRPLRDVHWTLNAQGHWNLDLEGRGEVRLTEGIVRVDMDLEHGGRPLHFVVFADEDELSHVTFTETGDPVVSAKLGTYGANFLEIAGREPSSLGADLVPGYLANHDGFVRVDRRDDGLVIHYSLTALYCEDIQEPPFTSVPPCSGRYFINSRPGASSRVEGCIMSLEDWRATPDACASPFQIDRVTPEEERENVAFDDPGLSVTFSEPVKLDTLGPAFQLHTLAPDGEELRISGEWQQDGASRYRFAPDDQLYSGTIYMARIAGGADGVQSRDGAWLEEDHIWSFSTLLDLNAQAPEDDDPVRLHNYQVVRDGELTRDKPTLTRAYITWDKHDDVAEDMQPDSFRMVIDPSVTYERRFAQRGGQAGRDLRIWRHDDDEIFSEDDRRDALHTANFFGWRPPARGGVLEWVVKPDDPHPKAVDGTDYKAEKDYEVWSTDPRELRLHYTFAEVGAWSYGLPRTVRPVAQRGMDGTARELPSFFPHRDARAKYSPTLPPIDTSAMDALLYDEDGLPVNTEGELDIQECYAALDPDNEMDTESGGACWEDVAAEDAKDWTAWEPTPEELCEMAAKQMPTPPAADPPKDRATHQSEAMLRYFSEEIGDWYQIYSQAARLDALMPPDDVIVIFAPVDFLGEGTGGMAQGMAFYSSAGSVGVDQPAILGFPNMRVYTIVLPFGPVDMDQFIQVNLHEIAHEFGLEHDPGDARAPDACPVDGSVAASELAGRNVDGIEAWRMTPDGLSGWNKSQDEGNAQADDGTLVSMMWPFGMSTNVMSLKDHEYRRLQRSVAEGPASVWQEGSAAPIFDGFKPVEGLRRYAQSEVIRTDAQLVEDSLIVTGRLSDTGLQINGIDRMVDAWPTPSTGRYVADLLDAQGRLLASAPLGLRAPLDPSGDRAPEDRMGWTRFRVALPFVENADRLLIRDGDRIRARLPAPSQDIDIRDAEVIARDTDAPTLTWRTEGPVGRTSIAYSPDGSAPWQMLAFNASDREFQVPLDVIAGGVQPTLRITAQTGIRFAEDHLRLPLPAD
ncbi:MAG: Ig-like domain-containing protein [Loktanella sp.]|nr:Ig-like domain-containing protein [Loktanella sp.]